MMNDIMDYFGKTLMEEVRDRTIRVFDLKIKGNMKDEDSQRLYKRIEKLSNEQFNLIEEIIPQIVDLSLHNMLCMVEENPSIVVQIENENIIEFSDGLAGELYTEDGWIQRFSKQRYEER